MNEPIENIVHVYLLHDTIATAIANQGTMSLNLKLFKQLVHT